MKKLILLFIIISISQLYGMKTSLHDAVEKGNAGLVSTLINTKNLNVLQSDGSTPLMLAARNGYASCVKLLIDAGADLEIADEYGYTALLLATLSGNTETVQTLVNAGANLFVQSSKGYTPFIFAYQKNVTMLQVLINAGIIIEKEHFGLVIKSNDSNVIKLINPATKSFAKKNIETLLMIYKENCSELSQLPKELLKIIITYAYPEYAIDHQSIAGLHPKVLVDKVPLKTLAMFIKNGILNQEAILGAWKNKITAMVQCLTDAKILSNYAIQKFERNALTIITILLTSDLYAASINGLTNIVKLLLANGANVNHIFDKGVSVICVASYSGHIDIVKLLLVDKAINVNHTDNHGWSALCAASYGGYKDIVELLLDHGANIHNAIMVDSKIDPIIKKDDTPLQIAQKKGHIQIVALLEEYLQREENGKANNKI